MKYLLIGLAVLAFVPIPVTAHTGDMMGTESGPASWDTMRALEDEALGDDALHERMDDLMSHMMAGQTLSQEELAEMVSYMDQYPAVHGMMMGRHMSMGAWSDQQTPMGMFDYHRVGGWYWVSRVSALVWLGVGIVGLIWLTRKVMTH